MTKKFIVITIVLVLCGAAAYMIMAEQKEQNESKDKKAKLERITKFLAEMDKDKDGAVDYDEFKAWHESRIKERFDKEDTNNDGVLSIGDYGFAEDKEQKQK